MVFQAGLFRVNALYLAFTGRGFVVGMVYIAVGLAGRPVTPRAFFTILSLSWPLALYSYRYVAFGIMEIMESSVAFSRLKVRSGPLLDPNMPSLME